MINIHSCQAHMERIFDKGGYARIGVTGAQAAISFLIPIPKIVR